MNKSEFIKHMSAQHNIPRVKAQEVIDIFVSSVIKTLAEDKVITLTGFGSFSVSKVPARTGCNPRSGEEIKIPAYNQPKFRAGQKLKDACNKNDKRSL